MTLPTLAAPDTCTGCSACRAACPRDAIAMLPDDEGFLRPNVDAAKCVGCHVCERACPILLPGQPDPAPTCFAARTRDPDLLKASASGGLFTELARPTLAVHGVVFGCVWEPGATCVAIHTAAETEADLAAMRGSKYVQSDLRDTFSQARAALREGRHVLFTGTPCQIAGLLRFLGRPEPNLLTVEIICHSTPSPAVLKRFAQTLADPPPQAFTFRDKTIGAWSYPALGWRLPDGRQASRPLYDSDYGQAFGASICARPSCSRCVAKVGASGADLTIGDLWGVAEACPRFDDGLGVSVVAAHTPAGRAALEAITPRLDTAPLTPEVAFRANPCYFRSAPMHRRRAWFMTHFRRGSFHAAVAYATDGPWPRRIAAHTYRALRAFIRNNIYSRGGNTFTALHGGLPACSLRSPPWIFMLCETTGSPSRFTKW